MKVNLLKQEKAMESIIIWAIVRLSRWAITFYIES